MSKKLWSECPKRQNWKNLKNLAAPHMKHKRKRQCTSPEVREQNANLFLIAAFTVLISLLQILRPG
jgi:hypothetical protein